MKKSREALRFRARADGACVDVMGRGKREERKEEKKEEERGVAEKEKEKERERRRRERETQQAAVCAENAIGSPEWKKQSHQLLTGRLPK